MKEIPINLIKENLNSIYFGKIELEEEFSNQIEIFKKLLFAFAQADENKELPKVEEFYENNKNEIKEWSKKNQKVLMKDFSKKQAREIYKYVQKIKPIKLLDKIFKTPKNGTFLLELAFNYGVENEYFTKDEFATFYSKFMLKLFK